jgi:hypothetical protein
LQKGAYAPVLNKKEPFAAMINISLSTSFSLSNIPTKIIDIKNT